MPKNVTLLNLLLFTLIGGLCYNLKQIWADFPLQTDTLISEAAGSSQTDAWRLKERAKTRKPALREYAIVATANIFRPERTEWTPPPPPPPPPPPKPKLLKKKPPEALPPPLPDPQLMGIVIEENERMAIMRGHKREEIKLGKVSRRRSRRKLPSRIVKEPIKSYRVGEEISDAKIVEILETKVILERDGSKIEIKLGSGSSSKSPFGISSSAPRSSSLGAFGEDIPFPMEPDGKSKRRDRPSRRPWRSRRTR